MAKTPHNSPDNVLRQDADDLLEDIGSLSASITIIANDYESAIARIKEEHQAKLAPFLADLGKAEKEISSLMKSSKQVFFANGDICRLPHGALIRELADKVKIPNGALAKCKELGFIDVIKIAKSLNREAVEKWTDGKLFLIGAERKAKEEFKYEVKAKTTI